MKIKFKKLFLALIFALLWPISLILTGCGATPSNKITGIFFDSLKYDEATGLPLFEVDENVETFLSYKVYPSSASGYKIYFDPISVAPNNSPRFSFADGKILINSKDFEPEKFRVRIGEYGFYDECIVKRKEYPVEIFTETPNMTVTTDEIVPLNICARFKKTIGNNTVDVIKNITEADYDFLVESSDDTVVKVLNDNRLKVQPIRNGKSTAEVTVTILSGKIDEQGNHVKTNLSVKISMQVVQNISTSFMLISGVNTIVKDGDTVDLNLTQLEDVDLGAKGLFKKLDFKIYPVNDSDLMVDDEIEYLIHLSSKFYANVSDDEKYILINNSVGDGYVLTVTIIIPEMKMSDGSSFAIDVNLIINR